MLRKALFLVVVSTVVGALGQPASAGGGWWNFIDYPSPLVAGEIAETSGIVLFETITEADRAREGQGFYAYLIDGLDHQMVDEAMGRPSFDPGWWDLGAATAYPAGTVSLRSGPSNIVRIQINLEIPEVAPGSYDLMLCDLGCSTPLADVVPSAVRVIEDPGAAAVAGDLHRFRSEMRERWARLDHRVTAGLEDTADEARVAALEKRIEGAMARLELRVEALDTSLKRLSKRVGDLEASSSDKWMSLGWFGLGGLLAGAFALRKRKNRRLAEVPGELRS